MRERIDKKLRPPPNDVEFQSVVFDSFKFDEKLGRGGKCAVLNPFMQC
jgi:hypothetical protein